MREYGGLATNPVVYVIFVILVCRQWITSSSDQTFVSCHNAQRLSVRHALWNVLWSDMCTIGLWQALLGVFATALLIVRFCVSNLIPQKIPLMD